MRYMDSIIKSGLHEDLSNVCIILNIIDFPNFIDRFSYLVKLINSYYITTHILLYMVQIFYDEEPFDKDAIDDIRDRLAAWLLKHGLG